MAVLPTTTRSRTPLQSLIAKEKEYGETWTGFEIVPLEIEQTKLNMAQSKTQLRMGVSVVHVEAVTEMMPIVARWSPEEEEEEEETVEEEEEDGLEEEEEEEEDGLVEDEAEVVDEDGLVEEEMVEEETVDEDGFADDEEEEDEVEEATEEEAEEDD